MFDTGLWVIYNLVAFFYLICGSLLLIHPPLIAHRLSKLFPVLATFRYQTIGNSLNLIGIGIALLVIGKLIAQGELGGFLLAITLSGLEVYLGVRFYYREIDDIPQALVHIILHAVLVWVIGWYILSVMNEQLTALNHTNIARLIELF